MEAKADAKGLYWMCWVFCGVGSGGGIGDGIGGGSVAIVGEEG